MDRRLGRLLPHQLPNPTRADPSPKNFPPKGVYGITLGFPRLFRSEGHVPTRYSPVRRSPEGALDLHVLGLPPAFVLSQDQTLKLKVRCRTCLDVRTSAHPIRREPDGVSARCAPFQGNGVRRAVKLTLRSSAEAYGADMPRLDHRMDQAARTSLQSPSISKSVKKQEPTDTAISQAPPAMRPRLRCLPATGACQRQPGRSRRPVGASAPLVGEYIGRWIEACKPFFEKKMRFPQFFRLLYFQFKINRL